MNKTLLATICLIFSVASGSAVAVEAPRPIIVLFNDVNLQVFIAGIDIATTPGIERSA